MRLRFYVAEIKVNFFNTHLPNQGYMDPLNGGLHRLINYWFKLDVINLADRLVL